MIRSALLYTSLVAALLGVVSGQVLARKPGWTESGQASWYGGAFAGGRTTSGERFDPSAMTAAHTTLPMGSRVRVTRQDTGASVVVSVNDRLPRHRRRVIDLSRGAASRLGIVRHGVAWVTLTPADTGGVVEVAEVPGERRDHRPGR